MGKIIAIIIAAVFAIAITAAGCDTESTTPTPERTHAERISDDDPRFNCLTMGNQRCGSVYRPVPESERAALGMPRGCVRMVTEFGTHAVCRDGSIHRY